MNNGACWFREGITWKNTLQGSNPFPKSTATCWKGFGERRTTSFVDYGIGPNLVY